MMHYRIKLTMVSRNSMKCLSDRMSVDRIQQAHQLIAVMEGIKAVGVYFVVFSLYVVLILSVKWRISSSMTSLVPSFHLCNMMVIGPACQALGYSLVDNILGHIHNLRPDSPCILWLSGLAGTGKSSVANSIALYMDSLGRLVASFQFDHNEVAQTLDVLIGCLCHQISCFDPTLKSAVLAALQRHGPNISCHAQTKKLLVDLISDKVEIVRLIVIVIDALDESGSNDVPVNGITHEDLVHIVAKDLTRLPCFVKIIITSQEEGSLVTLMSQCGSCKHLQIVDALNVEEDIMQYIRDRLNKIRHSQGRPHDWLTVKQIQELACYCDSHFICTTVALQFIEG